MRFLIFSCAVAIFSLLSPSANAANATVKLAWDANTEADIGGYRVKYGTASGVHGTSIDVGKRLDYTVTGLNEGQLYFFVVTAYNFSGLESDPSTEVSTTTGLAVPTANSLLVSVNEDGSVPVVLQGSDPSGRPLTFTVLNPPLHGSLSGISPNLTYTPFANYNGSDVFTFKANNSIADSVPASVALTITPQNDLPASTEIGPQTVALGRSSALILVTISDVESAASTLVLEKATSNTSVVPVEAIVLGGADADRTVQLNIPPTASVGSSTVTINVRDPDGGITTRSFQVTVVPDNNPPTISTLTAKSVNEDGSITFPVTVGDPETPAAALQLSGKSGNTTLVADSKITFGGSGADRTVTIVPTPDLNGTASITISVIDEKGAAVSSSFLLTVNPVHDLPVLSAITSQNTFEETVLLVPFSITSLDTPASGLTVTATIASGSGLPAVSAAIQGEGLSRTLILTPGVNQFGLTTVTLKVSDNVGSTSTSFSLRVDPVYDRPSFSPISAQSTIRNQSITVPLVLFNPDAPIISLSANFLSSNPAVITPAQISTTPGLSSLTLNPVGMKAGTSTITVQLLDELGLADSQSFLLTVQSINEAPTITSIPNQSGPQGVALAPIPFTIGDSDTDPASLLVDVIVDTPSLLPPEGVQIQGTGASRSLLLTPSANGSGETQVTVRVNDGSLVATSSFLLNVVAVNQPPEMSQVSAFSLAPGGFSSPISLLIFDRETPYQELELLISSSDSAVVAPADVVIANGPSTHEKFLTVRAGSKTGSASVSLLLRDGGGLTARSSFDVTVGSPAGPGTGNGNGNPPPPPPVNVVPNPGRDFTSNGSATLLLQETPGTIAGWFVAGESLTGGDFFAPNSPNDPAWRLVNAHDFNKDGAADLVFEHQDGSLALWRMNGMALKADGAGLFSPAKPLGDGWKLVAVADFNADSKPDLVLQHSGDESIRLVQLNEHVAAGSENFLPDRAGEPGWRVCGAGDFDKNGRPDLVLQHQDGRVAVWFFNGTTLVRGELLNLRPGGKIVAITDLNGDGNVDLVDQDAAGNIAVRLMSGTTETSRNPLNPANPGTGWSVVGPR